MRRALKAVLSDAGIDDLRIHDLRHSFASYLIAQGADLLTVKELCAHKSTQIMADVYGHLFPRRKVEAMATWDRLQDTAS